jgi:hypothetical protein
MKIELKQIGLSIGGIFLRRGINEIDDAVFENIKNDATIQAKINSGIIVVKNKTVKINKNNTDIMKENIVIPKENKELENNSTFDISEMSGVIAISHILKEKDIKKLNEMLISENKGKKRSTIKTAIKKQIRDIKYESETE